MSKEDTCNIGYHRVLLPACLWSWSEFNSTISGGIETTLRWLLLLLVHGRLVSLSVRKVWQVVLAANIIVAGGFCTGAKSVYVVAVFERIEFVLSINIICIYTSWIKAFFERHFTKKKKLKPSQKTQNKNKQTHKKIYCINCTFWAWLQKLMWLTVTVVLV